MELAARQHIQVLVATVDADQLIHFVVIRLNVFVFEWPGEAISVVDFEINVGIAQADAPPDIGLPAKAPDTDQIERLPGWRNDRLFLTAQIKLRRPLALLTARARFVGQDVSPEGRTVKFHARVQQQDVYTL